MALTGSDTFTITGYNANTGVVTVTFFVGGTTYTGVQIKGCPKDTVAGVKQFMTDFVLAYQAGKAAEAASITPVAAPVVALLNTATSFS